MPDYGRGELGAAFPAARPHVGKAHFGAARAALRAEIFYLLVGIGDESVYRHDAGQFIYARDVLHMLEQVGSARFERFEVGLAGILLGHSSAVFEPAHRRDHDDAGRLYAGGAALDVKELFRAEVGAEARFGDHVIGVAHGGAGGYYAVAAVRYVGEGSAVHERGRAFERLHEVGFDRFFEQYRHGFVRFEHARRDVPALLVHADDDVAQPLFEIGEIAGEAEHRHDLACRRYVEMIGALVIPYAALHVAERAVVEVERAAVGHFLNMQRVALEYMVIDHRGEQVVRRRDRVEIAVEMQIDVVHGHDLRVSAARRSALDAEYRPERRLAQREADVLSQFCHAVGKADGHRRFALARRRGIYGGDEHYPSLLAAAAGDLGFIPAVAFQSVVVYPQLRRNLRYGSRRDRGSNFYVRKHRPSSFLFSPLKQIILYNIARDFTNVLTGHSP